jgi:hypothetical protein
MGVPSIVPASPLYCRPCLEGGARVIEYLSRYIHRSAISNARLIGLEQDRVALRFRDYRDHHWKGMWLASEDLIQLFLLHVRPKGLMRIRHYGFLPMPICLGQSLFEKRKHNS